MLKLGDRDRPTLLAAIHAAAAGALAAWLLVAAPSTLGQGTKEPVAESPTMPSASAQIADTRLDNVLLGQLSADRIAVPCARLGDRGTWRYAASRVDLNGDAVPETLVLLLMDEPNGTVIVLQETGADLSKIASIGGAYAPIYVSDRMSHGWRALIVGATGADAGGHLLEYDGRSYPDNAEDAPGATVTAATAAGEVVVSETAALPGNMRVLVPGDCPGSGAREALADLRVGDGKSLVWERFRAPSPHDRSVPQQRDADLLYQMTWRYPKRGVSVQFTSERDGPPWRIESVTIQAPAAKGLTTSTGIGIGSARTQVERAYAAASIAWQACGEAPGGCMTVLMVNDYLKLNFDEQGHVSFVYLGPTPE